MSLLLYCVAPESAAAPAVEGVGGAVVRDRIEGGLRFVYSEASEDVTSSRDVVAAAQAVHQVVSAIFSKHPVLPFRFPTLVAGEAEIAKLASERGVFFRRFLERVGTQVQMDVRLTFSEPSPHLAPNEGVGVEQPGTNVGRSAGTAYLHARAHRQATLSAAAETCRLAARSPDWRIEQRGENIRCQVLIERVEVLSFLQRMRTLELPGGVTAAISGPWPPAGFWDDEPH